MKTMAMHVSDNLLVTILPDSNHDFLMTTKDVAGGYDIKPNTLRAHYTRHKEEFVEGKHWVKGVTICNTLEKNTNIQPSQMFWTKAGVIRFGLFVKGERAKLFRDWVEQLVVNVIERKLPALPETPKRKHNRLTPERLLDIMSDVCLIEDHQLRSRIANKIMGE